MYDHYEIKYILFNIDDALTLVFQFRKSMTVIIRHAKQIFAEFASNRYIIGYKIAVDAPACSSMIQNSYPTKDYQCYYSIYCCQCYSLYRWVQCLCYFHFTYYIGSYYITQANGWNKKITHQN